MTTAYVASAIVKTWAPLERADFPSHSAIVAACYGIIGKFLTACGRRP